MSTSYTECYDYFLSYIDDAEILYPFENESDADFNDRLHTILLSTFKKAITKFDFSVSELSRNNETEMFDNDLREVEIDIIGMLMLKEYYRKKLNFLSSIKRSFSDKDWKNTDPAKQMSQYREMILDLDKEIGKLVSSNSYSNGSGRFGGWIE